MSERIEEIRERLADKEYADDLEEYAEKRWADPHGVLSDHMTMVPRYTLREAARRLRDHTEQGGDDGPRD